MRASVKRVDALLAKMHRCDAQHLIGPSSSAKNKKPAETNDWTACKASGPVRAKAGVRFSRIC